MFLSRRIIIGAAGSAGFTINNSVYPDGSTGYFSRTPGVAGDRRQVTFEWWIKRTKLQLGTENLVVADTTAGDAIYFDSSDRLGIIEGAETPATVRVTSMRFRDVSAWYHIVVAFDTEAASAGDRVKIYVNGSQVTDFDTNNPIALNRDIKFSHSVLHALFASDTGTNLFQGYCARFTMVDGQALTASSFGTTDVNGVWKPKNVSSLTFGTTGCLLLFEDNANLGNDQAPGGTNDWTKTGTITQTTDSPTDKAASNVGNFCTLNPIADLSSDLGSLSEGNLRSTGTATGSSGYGTIAIPTSGKWYFEQEVVAYAAPNITTGIAHLNIPDQAVIKYVSYKNNDGKKSINGTESAYGATWTTVGDIIGVFYDADSNGGEITFYKNGTSQGVATTGLNADGPWLPYLGHNNNTGNSTRVNFGQKAFSFTMPTGAKRLATANLPAPTKKDPARNFDVHTRTGTGASVTVSGKKFQPDLIWTKSRSNATNNNVFDAVRGVQKGLVTNETDAEYTDANTLTAFNGDGYTYGSDSTPRGVNTNTHTYVDWFWKESTTAGFDVVVYSGDNTANRNVGHGLGVAPDFVLVKRLDAAEDWFAWHQNLTGNAYFLKLNAGDAQINTSSPWGTGNWSSTQFMVTNDATNNTNASGTNNYAAYLFTEVVGFSKIGQYKGNGNADGPFMWCGFRPKFILVKDITTGATSWLVYDAARETYNVMDTNLTANGPGTSAEGTNVFGDFVSNGFKLRNTLAGLNASGDTYIFIAFAEFPFGGIGVSQTRAR